MRFENAVAETTLIPLYMRAKESRRPDAILKDPLAERIVSEIDYDFSSLDDASMSYVGCVVRGHYYDERTRRFIQEHGHRESLLTHSTFSVTSLKFAVRQILFVIAE